MDAWDAFSRTSLTQHRSDKKGKCEQHMIQDGRTITDAVPWDPDTPA